MHFIFVILSFHRLLFNQTFDNYFSNPVIAVHVQFFNCLRISTFFLFLSNLISDNCKRWHLKNLRQFKKCRNIQWNIPFFVFRNCRHTLMQSYSKFFQRHIICHPVFSNITPYLLIYIHTNFLSFKSIFLWYVHKF